MQNEQPAVRTEKFKQIVENLQGIATICAIIVGGIWTYDLFIKEREGYPHAEISHKYSRLLLPDNRILFRVGVEFTNSGKSLIVVTKYLVRVQQILPLLRCSEQGRCAQSELNSAIASIDRKEDRFDWPIIAERTDSLSSHYVIEPGEKQEFDFEFVLSSDVKAVRVYIYFRNDRQSNASDEMGWYGSDYYDFSISQNAGDAR
jgi:hypothetical protein